MIGRTPELLADIRRAKEGGERRWPPGSAPAWPGSWPGRTCYRHLYRDPPGRAG
ncbi:hypothetical protein GCM10009733_046770 [Nonomuraea maheshkhaliensis]|uniref:Uncharacterized protein n=1 Tax=Nonomuraea maheshkhaliensis TaxID=419590 RepID=A0ABN2FFH4_9ACTN